MFKQSPWTKAKARGNRRVALIVAGSGLLLAASFFVAYVVALAMTYPPISWSYLPLSLGQVFAVGCSVQVLVMSHSMEYNNYNRLRKSANAMCAGAFLLATLSNAVWLAFSIMLWVSCVIDTRVQSTRDEPLCNSQVWAVWFEAFASFFSLFHSAAGFLVAFVSYYRASSQYESEKMMDEYSRRVRLEKMADYYEDDDDEDDDDDDDDDDKDRQKPIHNTSANGSGARMGVIKKQKVISRLRPPLNPFQVVVHNKSIR